MPWKTGSIWAQNLWLRKNSNGIITQTLSLANLDITVDASISLITHGKKNIWAEAGISRIVSNGNVETFDPPLPRIVRDNVTSITYRSATYDCVIWARFSMMVWT
jgi:hypothetical protein